MCIQYNIKCENESHLVVSDSLQPHGLLPVRILEWIAIPFFRGASQPRDWTQVSHIAGRFFTSWATRNAQYSVDFLIHKQFSKYYIWTASASPVCVREMNSWAPPQTCWIGISGQGPEEGEGGTATTWFWCILKFEKNCGGLFLASSFSPVVKPEFLVVSLSFM